MYACHGPMDCHDEIETSASIVQAFSVQFERNFAPYGPGFAGRLGSIAPINLGELVSTGREIFGVERVEIVGAEPKRSKALLCYGFGWKGTYAAGKYFDSRIYYSRYTYPYSWIIVHWDDANGDGFVNNPGDGDTYTLIVVG